MDGFESNHHKGIIVIVTSNRIIDLDEALLHPGWFDSKIKVDLPNFNEPKTILEVHAKNKNLSPEINLLDIAKQTFRFSGAELENILNEAAILALRDTKNSEKIIIKSKLISETIDSVKIGIANYKTKYDKNVKKIIAVHEKSHV